MGDSKGPTIENVMAKITDEDIKKLATFVAVRADIEKHVKDINFQPLIYIVDESLRGRSMAWNLMQTHIHIKTTEFVKNTTLNERFMKQVEQVLVSEDYHIELERILIPIIAELTGHYPDKEHEVVDMEVSNGSSPECDKFHVPTSAIPLPRNNSIFFI
uniref:Uncharacterized protein n=1 Tax=Panagrolaimus sp. ES5 TaxID=591445 RepID=A0AC34GNM3_9BILA